MIHDRGKIIKDSKNPSGIPKTGNSAIFLNVGVCSTAAKI
jgi:hypothetical protein